MRNLLLILLIIFFLISLIDAKKTSKKKGSKQKRNKKEPKNKETEEIIKDNNNTSNTNSNKKDEEEDDETATPDGYYMSDKTFNEKLKAALEKRNLKPNKKINKDILKKIFIEIYTKKYDDDSVYEKKEGEKMSKKESDDKMLNDVFENVGRSLDYDDKIKVSEIKEWIGPKRAQSGLNEIMDRMMDYL